MQSPMMQYQVNGKLEHLVQFEMVEAKNEGESRRQGRAVFDKVVRAFISSPGAPNQVVTKEIERVFWAPEGERPKVRANDILKRRYAEHLKAWQAQDDGGMGDLQGTPLRELHGLDVAQIAELRDQKIHTVEQLAALDDAHLFMGARAWREMARAHLEAAAGAAPMNRLAAENEALKDQVAQLQKAVRELLEAQRDEGEDQPKRLARRGKEGAA